MYSTFMRPRRRLKNVKKNRKGTVYFILRMYNLLFKAIISKLGKKQGAKLNYSNISLLEVYNLK